MQPGYSLTYITEYLQNFSLTKARLQSENINQKETGLKLIIRDKIHTIHIFSQYNICNVAYLINFYVLFLHIQIKRW